MPVRILVLKGRRRGAEYAASLTATKLTRLENYIRIPYSYEKSDLVAVPVLAFRAIKNAGMVTYAQLVLLGKPDSDPIGRQRPLPRRPIQSRSSMRSICF